MAGFAGVRDGAIVDDTTVDGISYWCMVNAARIAGMRLYRLAMANHCQLTGR